MLSEWLGIEIPNLQGYQKGRLQAQVKAATKLLLTGYDRDMISKTTGLSLDDLAKLAN
ncbi:hypothetical protein ACPV5G_21995 [Photobacterium damselae]|uniref:hypothetical protein n=1 Tax=Photobacterium damselae TaxID=38293 RepID=UPI004067E6BB